MDLCRSQSPGLSYKWYSVLQIKVFGYSPSDALWLSFPFGWEGDFTLNHLKNVTQMWLVEFTSYSSSLFYRSCCHLRDRNIIGDNEMNCTDVSCVFERDYILWIIPSIWINVMHGMHLNDVITHLQSHMWIRCRDSSSPQVAPHPSMSPRNDIYILLIYFSNYVFVQQGNCCLDYVPWQPKCYLYVLHTSDKEEVRVSCCDCMQEVVLHKSRLNKWKSHSADAFSIDILLIGKCVN